jgi:hypothetical protein
MPRTGAAGTPERFAIEEFSIGELLDDPIARLLMRSDGVDHQAVECLLLATRSAPLECRHESHWQRESVNSRSQQRKERE